MSFTGDAQAIRTSGVKRRRKTYSYDDLGDVILLYSECGGCCTVLCTFSWLILIGKDRTGYPATAGAYAADMEGSEMSPVDVDHDALASGTVLFVNVYFYELG